MAWMGGKSGSDALDLHIHMADWVLRSYCERTGAPPVLFRLGLAS